MRNDKKKIPTPKQHSKSRQPEPKPGSKAGVSRDDAPVAPEKKDERTQLDQPNSEGNWKSKKIQEKANLDPKTAFIFAKKNYEVMNKISAGAFGQVYTAINTKRHKVEAVKVMDLSLVSERFKSKFLPREIMVLIKVKHRYAIRVFDIFRAANKIYIFMEYASNGTLSDQVKNSANKALSEDKTRLWFKQTAMAIEYMHNTIHICHRDIKIENVLLDENWDAKISDFGFAKICEGNDSMSNTFCGTAPYYSPEIVDRIQYDPFPTDVWALGVMLFVMLNGKFPFHFRDLKSDKTIMLNEQKHGKFVYRPDVLKTTSAICKDLITKMFTFKAIDRITMKGVMEHEWVKK